ncbi:MAG TPA: tetratricopeptide repeat protein [Vicinamibacterales bacterium]|nr:tetratricopeptide repeat protein [Vicinamibacterales bacterium]
MRTALGLAALAAVFVVKLSVLLTLGHHPLLVPAGELDGAYYFHFARQAAAGDWWLADAASFFGRPAPAFFISPLYIYVLALFLKLGGGSLEAARFGQIVLGTAAVGLLALTAHRWYGTRAAWIAGGLAAFCGLFTFYEVLILQAALEPFLTALDLYVLTWALTGVGRPFRAGDTPGRKPRPTRTAVPFLLAGAALGLHALNRPNMLIVFAGLAVLFVARIGLQIRGRGGLGTQSALGAVALMLGGVLAISPATYRNWRVAHEFVPISSHGGWNFLAGNGPQADGTYTTPMNLTPSVAGQWVGAADVVRQAVGHEPSAREVSGFFFGKAFEWIRSHPREELRLIARKLRYALSATFLTLNHSFPFFARDLPGPLTALAVGPALIIPLGLVGLVVARPRERSGYWIWAAYIPLAIVSVVAFYVAARYRLPYQVALTVAAGGGAAWMIDRLRDRAWQPLGLAVAATAALAAFVAWPTGLDDGRAEEQVRMGLSEIRAGRTTEGEAWIQRATTRHGHQGVVHVRVGQLYESRDQLAAALEHYKQAAALDPKETSVQFVTGRALFAAGKDQDALAPLEAARAGRERDAATQLLVLAFTRLGRHQDANRVVRDLDPNRWTAEIAREFAGAVGQLGRVDLSIPAWRRAAEVSGRPHDYDRLGLAWAVIGRYPDAVAAFSEAVRRDPKSAPIRLNYAVALASAGRPDLGRRQAEEALKLDPSYVRAKQFLASLGR